MLNADDVVDPILYPSTALKRDHLSIDAKLRPDANGDPEDVIVLPG